jgi:hypothetical protein
MARSKHTSKPTPSLEDLLDIDSLRSVLSQPFVQP